MYEFELSAWAKPSDSKVYIVSVHRIIFPFTAVNGFAHRKRRNGEDISPVLRDPETVLSQDLNIDRWHLEDIIGNGCMAVLLGCRYYGRRTLYDPTTKRLRSDYTPAATRVAVGS